MPITIKHQAGAGLIGAYAAGQSSARRRTQKYAMDQLLLQQRHQQRLQEIGLRGGALGRAGRGAAGQQIVGWNDPIADDPNMPAAGRRRNAAARRARARKARLAARGKYYSGSSFGRVPAEWERTPIRQADVDRQQDLQDERRRHQDRLELQEIGHEAAAERATQSQQATADLAAQSQLHTRYAKAQDNVARGLQVLDPTVRRNIDAERQSIENDTTLSDVQREEELEDFYQNWLPRQYVGGVRDRETTLEEREAEREKDKAKVAREEAATRKSEANQARLVSRLDALKKELRGLEAGDREPKPKDVKKLTDLIAELEAELAGEESAAGAGDAEPGPGEAAEADAMPTSADLKAVGLFPKYYYGGSLHYLPPASHASQRAIEKEKAQILREFRHLKAQRDSAEAAEAAVEVANPLAAVPPPAVEATAAAAEVAVAAAPAPATQPGPTEAAATAAQGEGPRRVSEDEAVKMIEVGELLAPQAQPLPPAADRTGGAIYTMPAKDGTFYVGRWDATKKKLEVLGIVPENLAEPPHNPTPEERRQAFRDSSLMNRHIGGP